MEINKLTLNTVVEIINSEEGGSVVLVSISLVTLLCIKN